MLDHRKTGSGMSEATPGPHPQQPLCIPHLLAWRSGHTPDALAILAPGRHPLTYNRLWKHVEDTVRTLRATGLGRNDRVALVLPNGPEMAVAFLALASGATCMPLNPAYTAKEFHFYLRKLNAQALIVQAGMDSPARAVARAHDIRIIELQAIQEADAGIFTLADTRDLPAGIPAYAHPEDVALVLHTSGTTSQPKSVPLTHTNICISADHTRMALALGATDRYLNVMPLFHIGGLISGLLSSLLAGASVVCLPEFEACKFFDWLDAFRPTWYMGVSVIHQAILAHAPLFREVLARASLRFIRSPAAPLSPRVLAALEATFNVPVLSSYGVTEASLICCNPLPPRQRKSGSVGVAAGPQVAIVDVAGRLLPTGETGEIVIRGPNVMQGYENDPAENRKSYIDGWFRTGDQGFLDADGYLFITGRLKELINRGGELVAPQEVDNVFMEHSSVAQAVTFGVPHASWEEDVITAVVVHPHAAVTDQALRRFAATRLAPFKVPSQVIFVESVPMSSTGKPQRYRLTEQFGQAVGSRQDQQLHIPDTAPRTTLEKALEGLWTTILDCQRVGIYDNFFRLGGDSLLAAQLLTRIYEVTHVDISPHEFFDTPTIADIAERISAARQDAAKGSEPSFRSGPRDTSLPLSYGQQRLWFLEQLGVDRHAYNMVEAIRLGGPLQQDVLEQSFQDIVRRHEILRTTFTNKDGQPEQMIEPCRRLTIPLHDLRESSPQDRQARLYMLAQQEAQRPFDLLNGPLMRLLLVRLTDVEHVLIMTMHHLVFDGWSDRVLWQEVTTLYNTLISGQPSPLPELPIQYADFAYWQQECLQGQALSTQLAYWQRQLAGVPVLQLPTDYPRPAIQTFPGARYALTLSRELTQALRSLSQQRGVTLFMTLLAAFQTLLLRYTGQDDIAVGSLIANRNRIELEALIGFFVNTLILRTDLSGDPTFEELLLRVREVALSAYEHQDVPYEKLLEALQPARDLSHHPLFQVMCVLNNTPREVPALTGLTASFLEIDPGTSRFDVTLDFRETPDGLRACFEYNTELFEKATIARMAGHLQILLEGIVATPAQRLSQFPLLTADERQRVLVAWNTTTAPYPDDQCIHSMFETQTTRTPDAVAVIWGDASLTYLELNRRANQVAHYLLALGVRPETPVGLCIERSSTMLVGLLGILKAEAAYVPLDPTYPSERLTFMLADAKPPVVLTQERCLARLPSQGARLVCLDAHWPDIAQYGDENPIRKARAGSLAYVLYTSGSTGKPKGVLGLHRAVLNALAWMWQTYPFTAMDVCCQKTSVSFGDSIQELFGPLLRGIPTVLIPGEVLKDLTRFVELLARHRVTRLILVPSLLQALLDTFGRNLQDHLPNLTLWFAGGETLSVALCRRFRTLLPHARLINLYGASEASDDTTWYDTSSITDAQSCVPIGRPIANTQVYVLDQQRQPVPIGVMGELYVGGAGLTRGYLNRPELTAERFVPHPFNRESDARLYKTGDVVRYRSDGNIEYVGRSDQQVKLRGVRMELGEIETALVQHPAVRETAVIIREILPGEPCLVAYVVAAEGARPSIGELRRFLRRRLLVAMIPAAFVMLEDLPKTPSGKVDRQALPQPPPLRPNLEHHFVAPRTPHEEQVAAIWRQLLGLDRVSIHDNFFELGGHSLLAMRLLFRVRGATHVEVPLLRFFEVPTVVGIVSIIEEAKANRAGQEFQLPAIEPIPRNGVLPASIAQEHFWLFDQALPGLPFFNILYTIRLDGALSVPILEQSCNEIIRRHEALRTTFDTENGQLVQVIAPSLSMPLTVRDLRALPDARRESEARRLAQEEGQRPFDLRQGPLLRSCLLRLDEQEHILLVVLHHMICDGWSLGVLIHELAVLYDAFAAGEPSPLAALPIQYADFAAWQYRCRDDARMQRQLAYWRAHFQEPLPGLALPTDHPRRTTLALHMARQPFALSGARFEALKDLSRREGCTLFMMCLAAFKALLYGYTGQKDLCVATVAANRTRWETEGLIGLLVNTILLRTNLSGNPTLQEMLQRVRATTQAAYAHQDVPFEEVIRMLEQECGVERMSLCQVMMIWQDTRGQPPQPSRRVCRFEPIEEHMGVPNVAITTFDIILILRPQPQGLTGMCIYKTELFEAETISRMLDDLQYVLTCLSVRPEQPLAAFDGLRKALN